MHYKLFEMKDVTPVQTLHDRAEMLYTRQRSMLNNRSCFDGLQIDGNGVSLLSFKRFHAGVNANMTIRERIMSQLHDRIMSQLQLPQLDPFLSKYIGQFRIPDAELILRMIRCPNVLVLRVRYTSLTPPWGAEHW